MPDAADTAVAALAVLHVDDDPVQSALFRRLIAREPRLAMREAADAATALAMVRDWQPGALVIDGQLPDMDGCTLLRRLRALPGLAATPAIMCSADDGAQAVARARAAGFATHWTKPVPSATVIDTLLAIAARRR